MGSRTIQRTKLKYVLNKDTGDYAIFSQSINHSTFKHSINPTSAGFIILETVLEDNPIDVDVRISTALRTFGRSVTLGLESNATDADIIAELMRYSVT